MALKNVRDGIRTHDLPLRRRTLYPAELLKHTDVNSQLLDFNPLGEKNQGYNVVAKATTL